MEQHEREIKVGEFLDLNLFQWEAWLTSLFEVSENPAESLPDFCEAHASAFIDSLRTQKTDPNSAAIYVQHLSMLNDENLVWFVEQVGVFAS